MDKLQVQKSPWSNFFFKVVLLIGITGIENIFFSDVILTYKFTIFSQNDQLNQLIDKITIHLNVMV